MNALSIEGLELRRPEGFRLGPISLSLAQGSRTVMVGRSGSGKSTLLRCIAGLERPRTGTLRIGEQIAFEGRNRLEPHERGIGFVFQGGGLWPHLDAIEHLRFAARVSRSDARALLERVGLGGKESRKPAEMSGGEAQRLALARALAVQPRLLLLDEPFRSLDVPLRTDLSLLVRKLLEETHATLLAVTHSRDEALLLGEDTIVLDHGLIVDQGSVESMQSDPRTLHAATLVAYAAWLPLEGDGTLRSVFGEFPRPEGATGPLALVLMPGDVELSERDDSVAGRVLFVELGAQGPLLHVETQGIRLRVPHRVALPPGQDVHLRLCRAPRLLPFVPEHER